MVHFLFKGKHEVYLLKEESTCIYEIIILTPFLCAHPKYKPKDSNELKINCVPTEEAGAEPYSLRKLQLESAKLRKNAEVDGIKVPTKIDFVLFIWQLSVSKLFIH